MVKNTLVECSAVGDFSKFISEFEWFGNGEVSFKDTEWCIFNNDFINNISSFFRDKCINISFVFRGYLYFSKENWFLYSGFRGYLDSLKYFSAHRYYLCSSSMNRVRMYSGIYNGKKKSSKLFLCIDSLCYSFMESCYNRVLYGRESLTLFG
jgi:hypothetical protein